MQNHFCTLPHLLSQHLEVPELIRACMAPNRNSFQYSPVSLLVLAVSQRRPSCSLWCGAPPSSHGISCIDPVAAVTVGTFTREREDGWSSHKQKKEWKLLPHHQHQYLYSFSNSRTHAHYMWTATLSDDLFRIWMGLDSLKLIPQTQLSVQFKHNVVL